MARTGNVCLHITKTAGGTLKRALQGVHGLNTEFIYNAKDKENLSNIDLTNVDLIYGHAMFGVHTEINYGVEPRYFCFLRHPLSRTISHYYHLRNVDQSAVGDKIRKSSDINDFFANYSHWEFSNFMTRIVSGEGRAAGGNESDILAKAKHKLDTDFGFVGFQEFFSLSIRKLEFYLNVRLDIQKDINVGRYDLSGISETTLSRIEAANSEDLELYKYALSKYL